MEAIFKAQMLRKGVPKEEKKAGMLLVLPNEIGSGQATPNLDEQPSGNERQSVGAGIGKVMNQLGAAASAAEASHDSSGGKNRFRKAVKKVEQTAALAHNIGDNPRRSEGAIYEAHLALPDAMLSKAKAQASKQPLQYQLKTRKKEIAKVKATMTRLPSEKEDHFPIPFSPPEPTSPRMSNLEHFPNIPEAAKAGHKPHMLKTVKRVVTKVIKDRKSLNMAGAVQAAFPQLGKSQGQPQVFDSSLAEMTTDSASRVSQVLRALQGGSKKAKKEGSDDNSSDSEVGEGSEQLGQTGHASPKPKPMSLDFDNVDAKAQRQPVGGAAKKLQEVMREAKHQQQMHEDAERRALVAEKLAEERLQPNLSNFQQLSKPLAESALEWQPPEDLCSDQSLTPEAILEKLAHVLVDKFGSLKHAFEFLDSGNAGSIAATEWQSGIAVAHLGLEEAIGVTAPTLFRWIESATSDEGRVNLEAWQNFFGQLRRCSSDAASLLHVDRGALMPPQRSSIADLRSSITASTRPSFRDAAKIAMGLAKMKRATLKGAQAEAIALSALGSMGAPKLNMSGPSGGKLKDPAGFSSGGPTAGKPKDSAAGLEPPEDISSPSELQKHQRAQRWLQSSNGMLGNKQAPKATQPGAPGAPAKQEERRVDPKLDGRAVTYQEMCTGLSDQGLTPAQLQENWETLQAVPEDGSQLGLEAREEASAGLAANAEAGLQDSAAPTGRQVATALDAAEALEPGSPRSPKRVLAKGSGENWHNDNDISSESSNSEGEELQLPTMAAFQSAQQGASKNRVSVAPPNLKEVMSGKVKVEEVKQAEEVELAAEQQQLREELRELDISGVEALAYLLIAKFGSLKKAFRWFDVTRHEHISHNMWDTGHSLLRIDLETLTGFSSHSVFQMMDRAKEGFITRKDWKAFFAKIDEGNFKQVIQRNAKSTGCDERKQAQDDKLAKMNSPAARKKGKKRTAASGDFRLSSNRKGSGIGDDEDSNDEAGGGSRKMRRQRSGEGGDTFGSDEEGSSDDPLRARRHKDGRGGGAGGDLDGLLAGGKAGDGSSLREGHGGSASADLAGKQGDAEGGLSRGSSETRRYSSYERRPSQEEAMLRSFRDQVRKELSALEVNDCKDYSRNLGSKKCQIVREVAEEMSLWTHVQEQSVWGSASSTARMAPCVFVGHVRKFVSQTEVRLKGIKPGESYDFPVTLSYDQRRIVHVLAANLGQWTQSEGKGPSRKVVACNVGNFADEVREQLERLQPGEGKAFPSTLSAAQRKVVHVVAVELGMWCHTQSSADSTYVEVFNLADFVDDVRFDLKNLESGEQKEFSSSLTEAQRKVVHLLGGEMGLATQSQGEDSCRFVAAANLSEFREEVLKELKALGVNQRKSYSELTPLKRKVIMEVANSLQLRSNASQDDSGAHRVEVWGAGSTRFDANGTEAEAQEDDEESEKWEEEDEDDSDQAMIGRLFEQYATGSWNGQRIFLRFPDLLEFVEDMSGLMPQRCTSFRQKLGAMENIYEDTVQLQMDLGLKASKGLTLKYFLVFIQKILTKMGWEFFGLLVTLLDEI